MAFKVNIKRIEIKWSLIHVQDEIRIVGSCQGIGNVSLLIVSLNQVLMHAAREKGSG